jgi:hypothetical protein
MVLLRVSALGQTYFSVTDLCLRYGRSIQQSAAELVFLHVAAKSECLMNR